MKHKTSVNRRPAGVTAGNSMARKLLCHAYHLHFRSKEVAMKTLVAMLALAGTSAHAKTGDSGLREASSADVLGSAASLIPAGETEVALMVVLAVATVAFQVIHKYRASRGTTHRLFE
jgi:hypothetical protein